MLRRLRATDAADVLAAFASNPDMARQGDVTTLAEAEVYIADLTGPASTTDAWAIEHEGRVVGMVAVRVTEEDLLGWVHYWMTDAGRGRGWTSRAAATVCNWALSDRGLERLELAHRTNNPASGRVAKAAGFVQEGFQREKFLMDGARVDVITYGRLRTDPWPDVAPLQLQDELPNDGSKTGI